MNFARCQSLNFIALLSIGCVSTYVVERTPDVSGTPIEWTVCDFKDFECATQSQREFRNPELGIRQLQNIGIIRSAHVVRVQVQSYLQNQSALILADKNKSYGDIPDVMRAIPFYCRKQISDEINFPIKVQDIAWQKYFVRGNRQPLFSVSVLYLIPKARYHEILNLVARQGASDPNPVVSQFFKSIESQIATRKS